jgi:hypothetical protein
MTLPDLPDEYQNLVKIGAFYLQPGQAGFKEQHYKTACDLSSDAQVASRPASRYMLGYEALFQLVQAVLVHYGVRASDQRGHRIVAIQRVCGSLGLGPGAIKLISDAHTRRNQTTYTAPLPPITQAEADGMVDIILMAMPKAKTLLGL